jgi:hypothetical protein
MDRRGGFGYLLLDPLHHHEVAMFEGVCLTDRWLGRSIAIIRAVLSTALSPQSISGLPPAALYLLLISPMFRPASLLALISID